MLKGIAMEVKITDSDLPGNQHDTGSTTLDSLYADIRLYADIAALQRLVETLNGNYAPM